MSEKEGKSEFKFKLEEAKYFYEQMKFWIGNCKDEEAVTKFLYCLDAFLAAARNVSFVFEKEFKDNSELIEFYKITTNEWKKNPVMFFLKEMKAKMVDQVMVS